MAAVCARSGPRRAFLRGRPAEPPARPPWALAEEAFVDACSRCDACIQACPEAVLRRGDGGFPELRFERGECTFCAACLDICPTPALDRDQARPWRWRAEVDAGCLNRQGVVCRSCGDACAVAAVGFDLRRALDGPRIDAARCTGCGACVGVCPSSSIALRELAA
jgi:ferredoxin-type protein NapF